MTNVRWSALGWIVGIAILARLAVLAIGVANAADDGENPAFLWHDSGQYVNPAWSLAEHGTYSIVSGGQQIPYMIRPPAYPFFIAIWFKLVGNHVVAALIPQILLGGLLCGIGYWVAAILVNHHVGLVTGGLLAFDQMLIAYSNKIMAETFLLFFLLASILLLVLFLEKRRPWMIGISSLALGICTLSHGSTLYYAVLPIGLIAMQSTFPRKERARAIAIYLLVFLVTIGMWQFRNWRVFGTYQVVPTGHTIVQTAARVMSAAPPYRPYAELADECHRRVDTIFRARFGENADDWSDAGNRRRNYPKFLATQSELGKEWLLEHPGTFARLAVIGFLKMTFLPLPYAEICRFAQAQTLDAKEESVRKTMTAALKGLFRGEFASFWIELRRVPFCKMTGFAWNAVYWVITVPPFVVGAYLLVKRFPHSHAVLLLGTIAYFAVTTAIVQAGDGMQRYRLRLLPFWYCVAAMGWCASELKRPAQSPQTDRE